MRLVSDRRSGFGMTCVECNNDLIAPERSEHRDGRQIIHVWHCPQCDCRFEVISPTDTRSIEDIMKNIAVILTRDEVLLMRLVA